MSDAHGRFIWYELITPDTGAAGKFYGDLVGWTAQAAPTPLGAPPYTMLNLGGAPYAGMMPLMAEMKADGMPPNWTGYIGVDDLGQAVAKLQRLGGKLVRPAMEIPGVGTFAVVTDPAGAVFIMMQPVPPEGGAPPAPDINAVGQTGWHELYSGDPEATFAFYSQMFGWTKGEAMPMGEMGVYQLFNNQDGQIGGMMKRPPQFPAPAWIYYFRVPDIDKAAATAKAAGANIMMGPMEVPNGEWVFQAADPQGAVFAAVAKKA